MLGRFALCVYGPDERGKSHDARGGRWEMFSYRVGAAALPGAALQDPPGRGSEAATCAWDDELNAAAPVVGEVAEELGETRLVLQATDVGTDP